MLIALFRKTGFISSSNVSSYDDSYSQLSETCRALVELILMLDSSDAASKDRLWGFHTPVAATGASI